MTEYHKWFQDLQVERTIKALQKNNFDARYFPRGAEALAAFWPMVPQGATVGTAGSLTLTQIGFFEEAAKRPVKLLNPFFKGITLEESRRLRREIFLADFFVTSSNAITEDGELYNIDATGNRVGAMMYGPDRVVLFCGANKIVKDLADAENRVRDWASPLNAKRIGYKTPCTQTGECADCAHPDRICNIYTVIAKKPKRTEMSIFIIGETLGF